MSSERKVGRRLLWVLIAVVIIIQFIPVDRSHPPARSEIEAPPEVMEILRTACYDCHSYETDWPWYGYVAPVSWLLARHVKKGRADLNFSEWPALDFELQSLALRFNRFLESTVFMVAQCLIQNPYQANLDSNPTIPSLFAGSMYR